MTVKNLIKQLKMLPPDTEVVMASDEEGNKFSPVAITNVGYYGPTSQWAGEFYEDKDNIKGTSVAAVCIWPVA
jgi:hypothetical protein